MFPLADLLLPVWLKLRAKPLPFGARAISTISGLPYAWRPMKTASNSRIVRGHPLISTRLSPAFVF